MLTTLRLAIIWCIPHYLMFGCQPCWPVEFYFPTMRGMEKHQHVNCYIAKLCEWLWEAFKEVKVWSTSKAERQKWYYDRKANAISLETGDLVLAKADTYRGKMKVKDQWEEEPYEVEHQVAEEGSPFLPAEKPVGRMLTSPPPKLTFSHCSCRGDSPFYSHAS